MADGRIGFSVNVEPTVNKRKHALATTLNHLVVENGVVDIIVFMASLARVEIVTVRITFYCINR